ncbi:hypothetical protein DE146DRAFT_751707 [Phaeosphaeria sp. MPI-PUGE-AT-0046c]|nr:hypothetical protein DE146DRAFT_751707 [Phaeosphaeria sp. MPI-PUGE-AT-0046c]
MTNGQCGTPLPSHDMHNASSRSLGPASSQPQHVSPSPTKAGPAVRTFFDPWNSSSTGHQRAENRLSGSTSWRASRNLKLSEQYKGGLGGGGSRVADTVGAGSKDFGKDGRKEIGGWEKGAKGLRTGGQQSLAEVWGASKPGLGQLQQKNPERAALDVEQKSRSGHSDNCKVLTHSHNELAVAPSNPAEKQIFAGLCFYINGSTAPLVSDHRLKHMLAAHGAKHSIALGRRTVTHVLLGIASAQGGAGGSLAATKIQKEISKSGGKAVKFVTTEWVLESIKANRRLPESRFSPLKLAPKSQNSVFGVARAASSNTTLQDHG